MTKDAIHATRHSPKKSISLDTYMVPRKKGRLYALIRGRMRYSEWYTYVTKWLLLYIYPNCHPLLPTNSQNKLSASLIQSKQAYGVVVAQIADIKIPHSKRIAGLPHKNRQNRPTKSNPIYEYNYPFSPFQ